MSVPKEVILDLLPVYLAGEASPATQAWLEEYLEKDPKLAEQVRRQWSAGSAEAAAPALPPDLELRAFGRTRRILALQRWLFGLGMAFSAVSLSLEISFSPFRFRPLLMDYPTQLVPCLAAGAACWTAYFILRSRLRARRS